MFIDKLLVLRTAQWTVKILVSSSQCMHSSFGDKIRNDKWCLRHASVVNRQLRYMVYIHVLRFIDTR